MEIIYPLTLFLVIGAGCIALCARTEVGAERTWLVTWLVIALALRLGAATMFAAFPSTRIFHEDADGYEWVGMAIARDWHGTGQGGPISDLLENYGYRNVTAAVYYVFGQYAPLAAYLNCVIGTLTVFVVYQLARHFFHPLIARRAALLTALVPSMILWNAVALKESLMSLLIVLALLSCVRLKRRFTVWALIGVAASLAAVQPLRYYMIYFLGFAIAASLFLERGLRLLTGVYKQLLLVVAVATLLVIVGIASRVNDDAATLTLQQVSRFRHGMATTAASGFSADVDISTPGGALAFLPIGMANLLLGPFPWQLGSMRALFAAPETIYWWLLFPSLIRGLVWSIRSRFANTSPLVLFAVTMTSAYSLMHGNIGSGFRQRSQIFVILFIFAAFGLFKRRADRAGIDTNHLLSDELKNRVVTPPEPMRSAA
jgi:4-amino-4-deoxy-L-arabinose transferase-like glycosyltransferase